MITIPHIEDIIILDVPVVGFEASGHFMTYQSFEGIKCRVSTVVVQYMSHNLFRESLPLVAALSPDSMD